MSTCIIIILYGFSQKLMKNSQLTQRNFVNQLPLKYQYEILLIYFTLIFGFHEYSSMSLQISTVNYST